MRDHIIVALMLLGLFVFVAVMKLGEIYLYAVIAKYAWGM